MCREVNLTLFFQGVVLPGLDDSQPRRRAMFGLVEMQFLAAVVLPLD